MRLSSFLISIKAVALGLTLTYARAQHQPLLRRPNTISNENQQGRIETQEVAPGYFSVSVSPPADFNEAQIRRQAARRLEENQSCILYIEDFFYDPELEQDIIDKWVCTFGNFTNQYGGSPYPHTFDFSGNVEQITEFLKNAEAESGEYALRWDTVEAVTLNGDNTLTLNADVSEAQNNLWIERYTSSTINVDEEDEETNQRNLQFMVKTTGTKKTLVIRVVGDGIGPKPSLEELEQEVFGNSIGLKSQMEKCSHNKLSILPYSGKTKGAFSGDIKGGVVELRIGTNPEGINDKRMENDVMASSWYAFGDLTQQFDLVLFAMPPGIVPKFAAYAYIGTQFSYYNSDRIQDAMIQMHEVGHNLGLMHSGEGKEEYGDASGYMGYSPNMDVRMCYNSVNNYQLGWYSNLSIKPGKDDFSRGTYYISGVAGYDSEDSAIVSLRLEQTFYESDYYIGYNRASGVNSETQEDGDKVIIFTKDGGISQSTFSWKKAALGVGQSYVIKNFDKSEKPVMITFSSVEGKVAVVEVSNSTPQPTSRPTTIAPTEMPTESPTIATNSPTTAPTYLTTTGTTFLTTFSGTDCIEELRLHIDIRTDYFPEETYWKLREVGGSTIDETDPSDYDLTLHSYKQSYCLQFDTCYRFTINDTEGDGMAFVGGTTNDVGYYNVHINNELQFGKSGDWGKRRSRKFCTSPDPSLNILGNETSAEDEAPSGDETSGNEMGDSIDEDVSNNEP